MNGVQQNMNIDFAQSHRVYEDRTRHLSKSLFERQLLNGEKANRSWLIYSPSTGRVYCGPCLAFDGATQFGSVGFNDWKNAHSRVAQHENSSTHKSCILKMKQRGNVLGRIDQRLTAQLNEETTYWRNVLKRVAATIKALASRGLPFRGHDEKFGSANNVNYLMSLELLAEFDPFLADHISRYGNPGSGRTSYMSSTICDEFIKLMADTVLRTIVSEIKSAKYFSMIIDSSPDISHVDQLTFVIRYVQNDGSPIERFLQFIPNTGHKAQEMTDAVTSALKKFEIEISNCRGQSYDNASNMSGVYNGLQAQIKKLSPEAAYIPCAAHSLNLVGQSAAESCEEACWFFGLLQEVYNFFTASTHRWEILKAQRHSKEELKAGSGTSTVKSLSTTRWSARADACKSLLESWHEIYTALYTFENDSTEKPISRSEAKGIRLKLDRLETAFMTVFWGFLLNRLNIANRKLQAVNVDIFTAIQIYDSLIGLMCETRNNFDEYEKKALNLSETGEYEKELKRKRKRKLHSDESAEQTEMSGREKLRVSTFLVIIDKLLCELRKRRQAYQQFHDKFSFLTNLTNLSPAEVKERAAAL
ncbi:zinc finger MYM-type protein 1-like [Venturia canescens]|uniref:zinc finger MYM-type protein 1-like n=1 Tax=Venturia canescens TaxID=32260 RepID=UPI001C9BC4A9|nr:zinc finger MYM-type protein 1-like [Venturia canescens]